jgi:perosamine synthetase
MTFEENRIKLSKPFVGQEELEMVRKILESGWLTEGPITEEFERRVASYTGAKYAIATTSCTTALELALRASHVKPGDEVIVPDFTYPATADVVCWIGAKPVFVDVDISSYNINMDDVEKAITKKTKCILPVSWGGNPLNMKQLYELREQYGLSLIEDAACSLGSEYGGKKTGSMADITCFSFHPRKLITTGEGGMIMTDNEEISTEIRSLKRFGLTSTLAGQEFARIGTNCKLSDILAGIGIKQIEKIDEMIDKRIALASTYTNLLKGMAFVKPPEKEKDAKHVYQTYAIYISVDGLRDKIIQNLKEKNIEAQIGTYAVHLQKAFRNCKQIGNLIVAEKLYKNLLALPMYHSMTLEDQERIVKAIKEIILTFS